MSLKPDIERKLSLAVEKMPAFPRSVQLVLQMTRNLNCNSRELVGVIEKDPVMTMKILKVINSAYYGLPSRISSVGHAVVFLGLNTVKNLALSFAAVGILPRYNAAGFDSQLYLLHSLTTATLSRQLAANYARGETDPADCYIAGLLHDFGKAIFAQVLPTEFREALDRAALGVNLADAEIELIGADHGHLGAQLAARWQFAPSLVLCIRDHHDGAAPASPMLDCLRAADQISRKLSFGESGNPWVDGEAPAAPARFGGSLEHLIEELGNVDKILADAKVFAQMESR